jgi:hypothetical protein
VVLCKFVLSTAGYLHILNLTFVLVMLRRHNNNSHHHYRDDEYHRHSRREPAAELVPAVFEQADLLAFADLAMLMRAVLCKHNRRFRTDDGRGECMIARLLVVGCPASVAC